MWGSPATIKLSGNAGFACNHQAFRQGRVRLQPSGFPAMQGFACNHQTFRQGRYRNKKKRPVNRPLLFVSADSQLNGGKVHRG
jgi:hypothetical protein